VIYLTHEIAVWQAESQRIDAVVAQLNAGAAQQDQFAAAAKARADAARADATKLNAQAAPFLSQAAAADAKAASLQNQIDQLGPEPDKVIEPAPGKPAHPNPAWQKWHTSFTLLSSQLGQAQSAAAAARASAAPISASAAASLAAAATADNEATNATAQAVQLRQQAMQQASQKAPVGQAISAINRWQQELARQPLDQNALEITGGEIASQISLLQSQYSPALDLAFAAEKQQWFLQTLIQELTAKINDVQAQAPGATTELANATSALADIELRIQHVMKRLPE
jgi:hypothetical protein